jgi:alkylation response protein AidB-like acyl-CoA dehydrogenase
MNFDYSEEQQLLAASIRRLVEKQYDFETRNAIVGSDTGVSDPTWRALADLGLLALPLPADAGGFDGGAVDLMSAMEAFGEALLVEPYLATIGLAAQAIRRSGELAQRSAWLPRIATGELRMAFAHAERDARYDLAHVGARARRVSGGYVLDGAKAVVLHAPCADAIVVSARSAGAETDHDGISLFVVDAKNPGLALTSYRTLDEMRAADLTLNGVQVTDAARIGDEGGALALIEEVVDFATALICAEAVGAMRYAVDATLEYLKTRKQFGVPIGSFQALQHRMVDMVISGEQARSMASLACTAVDTEKDASRRKRTVSAAKVRIADACRHIAQESVQLHGGMGMTQEMKISHTFRRLTMIAQQFGDADHHLERFASVA